MVPVLRIRQVLVFVAVITIAVGSAPAASGSPVSPGRQTADATYQGRYIDLGKGWQGAQSCVVFGLQDVRCFATHDGADRLLGYSQATDPMIQRGTAGFGLTGVPACAYSWLCLYEHAAGGGRRLIFRDEYWQYLAQWNFDRQTSSWRNNQGYSDRAHLAMHGSTAVYNLAANSYDSELGEYNDRAYAVWA